MSIFERIIRKVRSQDQALIGLTGIAFFAKLALMGLVVARLGEHGLVLVVDDGLTYLQIAQNIIAGHGFSLTDSAPYIPDVIRVPLVPYLMAASLTIFHSLIPFVFLEIFLSIFQGIAVWYIAEYIGLPRVGKIAATALSLFEPAGIMLSVLAISEPLFTTALLLSVFMAIRIQRQGAGWGSGALLGFFLGFAALTRPIGLYVIPIIVLWLIIASRKQWRYALITLCVAVICVAPWFYRNYRIFGVIGYSSGGFQNLYLDYDATMIAFRDNRGNGEVSQEQYNNAVLLSGLTYRQVFYQDLRLNNLLAHAALVEIAQNPYYAAKTLVYTEFIFFTNDSYQFYYLNRLFNVSYNSTFDPTLSLFKNPAIALPIIFNQLRHQFFLSLIGRVFFSVTSLMGVVGLMLLMLKKKSRSIGILLFILLVYFALASATGGYGVTVRYRFPVQSFLFLGTVVLSASWAAWYHDRHARKAPKA